MIIGHWLLIETLGRTDTWSVLAVDSTPRMWKSFQRAVPSRLQPAVGAVYTSGEGIDQVLPQSRHSWSGHRLRAIPVHGPGGRVHAVHLWLGTGDPPPRVGVAPFWVDARIRRIETLPQGLGPHFGNSHIRWDGAESFAAIERFDGALEFTATIARSTPDTRWLGTATIRSATGPRSVLLATRNGDTAATRQQWLGVAVDVTDSIAPQRKSFEANTLDLLREAQPNLYLVIVDTAQVRLVRWVSQPVPGLRWRAGVDARDIPHPDDRGRILAVRDDILSGTRRATLPGVRLAAEQGGWITADLEISPLPGGTPDADEPEFVLVQLEVLDRPSTG